MRFVRRACGGSYLDEEEAHPVGTDNSAGLRPAPCLTSIESAEDEISSAIAE